MLRLLGCVVLANILFVASASAESRTIRQLQAVDLELVLAVDVSGSMSPEEQRVQREGYADAFRHNDVINRILSGGLKRIAVVYMEWSGQNQQTVRVPWTVIDSRQSAFAFADQIEQAPWQGGSSTSISAALVASATLFDRNDYIGTRRVIDISGDGLNNSGGPVSPIRDAVLDHGIVINGLPIMLEPPRAIGSLGVVPLDTYFENCVIGGPRSFIVPVLDAANFANAIRKKLLIEVSDASEDIPIARIQKARFATRVSREVDCIPSSMR